MKVNLNNKNRTTLDIIKHANIGGEMSTKHAMTEVATLIERKVKAANPSLSKVKMHITYEENTGALGTYQRSSDLVTINIATIETKTWELINSQNSQKETDDETNLRFLNFIVASTVLHEFRHAWQYRSIPMTTMINQREIDYTVRPCEIDANMYAENVLMNGQSLRMADMSSVIKDNKSEGVVNMTSLSTTSNTDNKLEGVVNMNKVISKLTIPQLISVAKVVGIKEDVLKNIKKLKKDQLVRFMSAQKIIATNSDEVTLAVIPKQIPKKSLYMDIRSSAVAFKSAIDKGIKELDTVTILAGEAYVVDTERDLAVLIAIEGEKDNSFSLKSKKYDSYIPNMDILGKYFKAIIYTEKYVKAQFKSAGMFGRRTLSADIAPSLKVTGSFKLTDKEEEYKIYKDMTKAKKTKNSNVKALSLNLMDIGMSDVTLTEDKDYVYVGESEAYDMFGKVTNDGTKYFDKFVILDTKSDDDMYDESVIIEKQHLLGMLAMKGVYINTNNKGTVIKGTFTIITRNASQQRGAMAWLGKVSDEKITDNAEFLRLREELKVSLSFGHSFYGKKISAVKVDNYVSLLFTSSKSVFSQEEMKVQNEKWTVMEIEDPQVTSTEIVSTMTKKDGIDKIVEETIEFTRTPHDGASWATFDVMAEIAMKMGEISKADFNTVLNAYNESGKTLSGLKEKVLASKRLSRIFNNIPSVLQIRGGFVKGILAIADIKEYARGTEYEDANIILGSSSIKLRVEGLELLNYLRVANYSKAPKKLMNLNYQFIQSLEIENEDLIDIAKESLTRYSKVMSSFENTIEFLNLYSNTDDDDTVEEADMVSRITRMIMADKRMLYTPYVQQKLFGLIRKRITDMRLGRIEVEGAYQLVITDPRSLFNKVLGTNNKELTKDEAYWNGNTGEYSVFRAPLAYKSSMDVINLTDENDLWYLTNAIVLSAYCTTLERLSGADIDGDKFAITRNKKVIKSSKNHKRPFLYTKKGKQAATVYTQQAEFEIYRSAYKQSDIGKVANYHTILRDAEQCTETPFIDGITGREVNGKELIIKDVKFKLDEKQALISMYQGKVIDAPKTGEIVVIPEELQPKKKAHWMKGADVAFNSDCDSEKIYVSTSSMGQLYDYISAYVQYTDGEVLPELSGNTARDMMIKNVKFDPSIDWSNFIDYSVVSEIYGQVVIEVKNYNRSIAKILASTDGKEEDVISAAVEEVINVFTTVFDSLKEVYGEDEVTYCIYSATEEISFNAHKNQGKSILVGHSCPWATSFESMYKLTLLHGGRTKYVRLNVDEDIDMVVVNASGDMFTIDTDNNTRLLHTDVYFNEGIYEVKGSSVRYIETERNVEGIITSAISDDKQAYPTLLLSFNVFGLSKIKTDISRFAVGNSFGIKQSPKGIIAVDLVTDKKIAATNITKADMKDVKVISTLVGKEVEVINIVEAKNGGSANLTVVITGQLEEKSIQVEQQPVEDFSSIEDLLNSEGYDYDYSDILESVNESEYESTIKIDVEPSKEYDFSFAEFSFGEE